ncbi:MAG: hypothetical protein ACRC6U_07525 [Fusobacteriaceae bacterium]
MKKYFNKFIVTLIALIFLLAFSNNFFLMKTDFSTVKYKKVPKNLKIINLGSSHTEFGIIYPENIKGYNLGLSAQPLYYDYEILKKYSNKLEDNAIVIIPVSIFTFYHGNDFMKVNNRYYNFLDYNQIFKRNYNAYFSNLIFGFWKNKNSPKTIFNFFEKNFYEKKISLPKKIYPKNTSVEDKQNQLEGKVRHHLAGITDSMIPQDPEISKKKLLEILNYIKANNLRPVFITTPQTWLYNSKMTESIYKERIYDQLKNINIESKQEILYLDYSHDFRFEKNLEYFFDVDHLNENGAKLFTEIMLNDLKEKKLL